MSIRSFAFALVLGSALAGCGASPPPSETAPAEAQPVRPESWAGPCADAGDCVLILTEPGECCSPGVWIAVHRAHEEEATREVGFISEEAPRPSPICTDSCRPPADPVAACVDGRCLVR